MKVFFSGATGWHSAKSEREVLKLFCNRMHAYGDQKANRKYKNMDECLKVKEENNGTNTYLATIEITHIKFTMEERNDNQE